MTYTITNQYTIITGNNSVFYMPPPLDIFTFMNALLRNDTARINLNHRIEIDRIVMTHRKILEDRKRNESKLSYKIKHYLKRFY